MTKVGRQPNFEILRVLAMVMIVTWHFLLHAIGSQSFTGTVGTFNYVVRQFLYILCSSCVNLFVLVSGYFMIEKPFNWRRMGRLWLEVVFYAFGISLLFYLLRPGNLTLKEVFQNLLPVRFSSYWFFRIYLGLMFLAPFLSKVTVALTRTQYKRFLTVLFLLCCTLTMGFPYGDSMGAGKGYTLLWFIELFFLGGYFRRFAPAVSSKALAIVLLSLLVTAFVFVSGKSYFLRNELSLEMPAYNGIGILIAVPVFLWFKQKEFKDSRLMQLLASAAPFTFAVYLISEHPQVSSVLWHELFDRTSITDSIALIPYMVLAVFIVFALCVSIDYLRTRLFKVCRIDATVDRCADYLSTAFDRIIK